jgi:hypothetical protein
VDVLIGTLTGAPSLDDLARWGRYLALVAIVFTETGLLVGFFLPGDSLLISAGLVAAAGHLDPASCRSCGPLPGGGRSRPDGVPAVPRLQRRRRRGLGRHP